MPLNLDEKCILCGGVEFQKLFSHISGEHEVVRCVRCGLAWKRGISSWRQEEQVQKSANFEPLGERLAAASRKLPLRETAVAVTLPERFSEPINPVGVPSTSSTDPQTSAEEMEEIGLFKKPPGTLLTVGPDPGDLLETSRVYGWSLLSLDRINENEPTEETDVSLSFRKTIPDSDHRNYDVIRLSGSLENALDPCAYLKGAGKMLGPTGLLVVSVPDLNGWDFPLYGQGASSCPMDLPNWFFTQETLVELLGCCGFKVLRVTTVVNAEGVKPHPENMRAFQPTVFQIHRIYGEGSSGSFNLPLFNSKISRSPSLLSAGRHFRVFARRDERRVPAALRSRQSRALPAENPVEVFV